MILAICAACIYLSLPNFLSQDQKEAFPEGMLGRSMSLGLDLRGGSHLLLEMDFDAYLAEQMETLRTEVKNALKEEGIGFLNFASGSGGVSFTLRRETMGDKSLRSVLMKAAEGLEYEENGDQITVHFSEAALKQKKQDLLRQSIEIVNRRVNELGTTEPSITRQGDNRILVQVPGLDSSELKPVIGKTAKMTFHMVNENVTADAMMSGKMPLGTRLLQGDESSARGDGMPRSYPVYTKVELSGEMLTNAYVSYDQGQPVVAFSFDTAGARKFADITRNNVGKPFAIVLDNKVITAPVIQTAIIGGNGVITGNFTTESANNLAILLRAGALPAPMSIVEERSIGPSLGEDSIKAGQKASLIAIALIMGFMVLAYGIFGVFANIGLLINLFMIVGVLSLVQATLTLPGIAGIVLTLGMAVDANVLIYERMREESARGRTTFSAIEHGFRAAFATIIDAHVTGLVAAAILFAFGTGTIKGFAVTLSIGIAFSLFSAVLLTRLMVVVWLKRTRPKKLPI